MQSAISAFFLFCLIPLPLLWAAPGQVENMDYKAVISETLPGIDNNTANPAQQLPADAGITVTVTDKFRSQQTLYPLKAYAVNGYFLLGDTLNLVARTTLINSPDGPRYSFLQLNLPNPPDSRQFQNLRQYSLSPDQQILMVLMDNGGSPPLLGLSRLTDSPAGLAWIYAEPAGVNLFKSAFAAPVTALTLNEPVAWAADSLSAVFLLTADDGTKDAQGKPVLKDYLADLELTDNAWKVSAREVDLSSYHFHSGEVLTNLQYAAGEAKLFFTSQDSANPVEADFPAASP